MAVIIKLSHFSPWPVSYQRINRHTQNNQVDLFIAESPATMMVTTPIVIIVKVPE